VIFDFGFITAKSIFKKSFFLIFIFQPERLIYFDPGHHPGVKNLPETIQAD
jgi:hypothetical protein